ncbi:hypothetical protein DFH28DRAFT_1082389 [Melampsora americana]|nr:hypothetical protein DFH28DRAFT_1082389 [Melampsora americana]
MPHQNDSLLHSASSTTLSSPSSPSNLSSIHHHHHHQQQPPNHHHQASSSHSQQHFHHDLKSTHSSVLDWNESQVNQFFISLGLTRFETPIREHGVTGDVLIHLDNDLLKDMGVNSVGKRLTLLKAVYKLKLKEDIPIDEGQWVPPSGDVDLDEFDESLSSSSQSNASQHYSILRLIQSRDHKISLLESEIKSIRLDLQAFLTASSTSQPRQLVPSNPPSPITTLDGDRHPRDESSNQSVNTDQSTRSPRLELSPPSDPTLSRSLSLRKLTGGSINTTDQNSSSSTSTTPTNDPNSNQNNNNLIPIPNPNQALSNAFPSPNPSQIIPHPTPTSKDSTSTSTSPNSKEKEIHNPYKSFRVTLEDPCYKKPLLLFQKLKEANQNPVFTLRHIKDIESPISIALSKQAQRREQIQKKNAAGGGGATVSKRAGANNAGAVEPTTGFCVAIYPYMSEGEEDFDVGVGDTFLIVGKSKGWWVVHRDDADGKIVEDKTPGWVPSGCVLETKHSFATSKITYSTPILPEHILSVSSCTNALMDYKAKGADELSLTQGDSLRVYKKYNNWSYAINESHPDKARGWTPSWLVGGRKESSSNSLKPKPSCSSLTTITKDPISGSSSNLEIQEISPSSTHTPDLGIELSGN